MSYNAKYSKSIFVGPITLPARFDTSKTEIVVECIAVFTQKEFYVQNKENSTVTFTLMYGNCEPDFLQFNTIL